MAIAACCPPLVVLMGWVILMFLTDLNIRAIGRKPIRVVQTLVKNTQRNILFNGWVWAVLLIPVACAACLHCGYGGARWECYAAGAGYTCRNLLVICLLFFGSQRIPVTSLCREVSRPESSEYLYFRDYQAHMGQHNRAAR